MAVFPGIEDSRNVALALPHFLLRIPYGPDTKPVKGFNYKEDTTDGDGNFLWGNAAFAFASRITDSFGKYRWCANIIGPQGGGAVEDLPIYQYEAMGELQTKIPTEVLISERREFELAEEGFVALTMRRAAIMPPSSPPTTQKRRSSRIRPRANRRSLTTSSARSSPTPSS